MVWCTSLPQFGLRAMRTLLNRSSLLLHAGAYQATSKALLRLSVISAVSPVSLQLVRSCWPILTLSISGACWPTQKIVPLYGALSQARHFLDEGGGRRTSLLKSPVLVRTCRRNPYVTYVYNPGSHFIRHFLFNLILHTRYYPLTQSNPYKPYMILTYYPMLQNGRHGTCVLHSQFFDCLDVLPTRFASPQLSVLGSKISSPCLGVSVIRSTSYWGLYWGPYLCVRGATNFVCVCPPGCFKP